MEDQKKRLNKFLSESGFCSRREADRLIEEGRVTVNDIVPEMGTRVSDDDEIRVNGQLIKAKQDAFTYLAFYKPIGIECTTNTAVKNNIVDYINYHERIFPIGRLDKDSEGLILMTNDGDIVNKILRGSNNHEKEYLVTVNKPITERFIEGMRNGVPILDTVTKKCRVEQISKNIFRIFLTQGLNRQIRRMCEYFDYEVMHLKRIRVLNISLDIAVGEHRKLTAAEMKELNQIISSSDKHIPAEEGPQVAPAKRNFPREKQSEKQARAPRNERRNATSSSNQSDRELDRKPMAERPLRNERRNPRNK
ncbi:23S rRNA pseudouridine(2604) synthase RluF [Flavobacterium agricola]|uniref:Pseudouridine synthase n=1 Tax=Flavobacterium agricola TaxID=2870839 RepID=A0ABY6M365_9FLAO|nr:23S rRNA pseudouridine(2604) synthase RluF [Flavobacterium agricola]UYW01641.1 23S rRNA pseudouridine(2604) synthase RluF [Flavobacterium agricola]